MPEFTDAHGIQIVYDVHRPEHSPRGVVQLLHGVGEHAGRYGELIDALTAAGFAVYADDHRGHGRTGMGQYGDAARLGELGPGGLPAALDAVWQLSRIIRAENPDAPVVLLGHSWGSFLAQMLLDRHPDAYDALVLSGSALRWPGSLNAGNLNAPWAGDDPTGLAWLSTDPAVGAAFAADPLTTSRPLLQLFSVVDSVRLFGRPRRGLREKAGREVPVLLMVGRDDTVGGPVSVHRLARAYRERAGLSDVTTLVYPACATRSSTRSAATGCGPTCSPGLTRACRLPDGGGVLGWAHARRVQGPRGKARRRGSGGARRPDRRLPPVG